MTIKQNVEPLIPAHRKALRRIARGDVFARIQSGIATIAVVKIDGDRGGHAKVISDPAFRELRDRGLIRFPIPDDGRLTTSLIEVTAAGRDALERA